MIKRFLIIAALLSGCGAPKLFAWHSEFTCLNGCIDWVMTQDDQLNECPVGGMPEWHQAWAVSCYGVGHTKEAIGYGAAPRVYSPVQAARLPAGRS